MKTAQAQIASQVAEVSPEEFHDGLNLIAGTDNADRQGDVIFVHGLGGHPRSTWHPKGISDFFWPIWLAQDLGDVGVWSFGYAASPSEWLGRSMPIEDRAVSAVDCLETAGFGDRPLVFVTHSLGGRVGDRNGRQSLSETDRIGSKLVK